jgi:hypothetical protein
VEQPPRRTRNRAVWWVVGVMLLIPIVIPLIVPIYARQEPELFGFPFYYWYQFLWILIAATLTSIAYLLASRQERRDRESGDGRRGGVSR